MPVAILFRVKHETEATAVADDSPFGLADSVFTMNIER